MTKISRIHLFTNDIKTLVMPPKHKKYGYYLTSLKKASLLYILAKNDNLEAIIYANITYQKIDEYIKDICSEIKKYESIVSQPQRVEITRSILAVKSCKIYQHNPIAIKLHEALVLTDELIVLMLTAKNHELFVDGSTFFTVKSRVRAKLFKLLRKIIQIPIRHVQDVSAEYYLKHPESFPRFKINKVTSILSTGVIKKYKYLANTPLNVPNLISHNNKSKLQEKRYA